MGVECDAGSTFVMYDEAEPVALWRMRIAIEDVPTGYIERIFFKDGVEEGDKLFFLHAMMFKLREGSPIMLKTKKYGELLKRFGFAPSDESAQVYQLFSGDINLYYNCGGNHGRHDQKLH